MPGGRPTHYNTELADKICKLCSERSLISVIRDNPDLPDRTTIYDWLDKYEEFANKYAKACQDRADFKADEIDEIADDTLAGKFKADAAKVAIDAKKWAASKLRPKRYGERMQHANDEESPVNFNVVIAKTYDENN